MKGQPDDSLSPKHIQLIRSTYRLMGRKGAGRISLQDIADEAGVSKGIIIYYFKTKERLILATMRWMLARTVKRMREAMPPGAPAPAKMEAVIHAAFVAPGVNRRFYLTFLDLLTYAARVDRFRRLIHHFRTSTHTLYKEIIQQGVEERTFSVRGQDEAAVERAADAVRALVDGFFVQWIQEPQWLEQHPVYRARCKEAVFSYLQGDPSTQNLSDAPWPS